MILDLLDQILPHIQNAIYPASISLPHWKVKEGDVDNAHSPSLKDTTWGTIQIPARWGGYNRTVWFRTVVEIPPEFAGKTVGVLLDFPEALLYVNGTPHQGIDQHHREAILSHHTTAGEKFHLAAQAYSGRKTELNSFARAELVVVDTTARALFTKLRVLRELDRLAGVGTPESKEIRELIRRTLIYVKYYRPGSEEYPNAIARAVNFLNTTLGNEFQSTFPELIHLIAQSHLDVAWLWTLKETRRKAARTFSTALRLMEEFPSFTFTQSQAQLYEYMRQDYPALFQQIQERIREGRWEVVGSMWVEPDCNLLAGESLVRQILLGKRFFSQMFGIDQKIMWLPDTYGFPASFPQILKKAGIEFFFSTRLHANDTTRFPYHSFWWRGIDGSKILCHLPPSTLDAQLQPAHLLKSRNAYQQKELLNFWAQTFGYGDGGGGPSKEQLDVAPLLSNIVSLPQSCLTTAGAFFQKLSEQEVEFPTWSGELYLEKHRGTYTTQSWIKKENRHCESLLTTAELFSVFAAMAHKGISTRTYPARALENSWKELLLNQSHTILTGVSLSAVYDEAQKEFATIRRTVQETITSNARHIIKPSVKSSSAHHFTIFNPSTWARNEYITLKLRSKAKGFLIVNERGEELEYQIVERSSSSVSILCYVQSIPPTSYLGLTVTPLDSVPPKPQPWVATPKRLETPLYRIHLNKRGMFTSIQDKRTRRDLIRSGSFGNQFQTYPDKPKQWEAWEIDPDNLHRKTDLLKTKGVKVIESGPLRATVQIELKSPNGSLITQHVRFYHSSPRIDFDTTIRWFEKQILLKVAFALNVKTKEATFEIPFGVITRTTKARTPAELAKFEVPTQQWMDLSDSKYGISLLNNGKYGHDIKETTVRLTLLRSPHYPHPLEPWRSDETKAADQGVHTFSYALYPHLGDWKKGETVHRAREFNNPVLVLEGTPRFDIPPLVRVTHPSLQMSAVKKAEDDDAVILRLYDAHGDGAKATLEFGHQVVGAVECDLMENEIHKLKPMKSKLQVVFKPFEIKTLKLRFKAKVKKRKPRPQAEAGKTSR